ncbi:MAG: hypothetical protein NC411_08420 [Bacteroides sp.]|nr:hypothetical protein [Bacteroides sp.]
MLHKILVGCILSVSCIAVSCSGSSSNEGGGTQVDKAAAAEALLMTRCESTKSQFPIVIDDYTTQVGVELLPTDIHHIFKIDEGRLGVTLDDPQVSGDALYDGIIESLCVSRADSVMRSEMEALVATGRGVIYSYEGDRSRQSIRVRVTPETLDSILTAAGQ